YRYFGTYIFFGNAKLLLHLQFHRQAMGIPAPLSFHAFSLHRMVPANYIFDSAGHHVVDTRLTVGRGRSFIEYEGILRIPAFHTLFKYFLTLPKSKDVLIDRRQMKSVIFLIHKGYNF